MDYLENEKVKRLEKRKQEWGKLIDDFIKNTSYMRYEGCNARMFIADTANCFKSQLMQAESSDSFNSIVDCLTTWENMVVNHLTY